MVLIAFFAIFGYQELLLSQAWGSRLYAITDGNSIFLYTWAEAALVTLNGERTSVLVTAFPSQRARKTESTTKLSLDKRRKPKRKSQIRQKEGGKKGWKGDKEPYPPSERPQVKAVGNKKLRDSAKNDLHPTGQDGINKPSHHQINQRPPFPKPDNTSTSPPASASTVPLRAMYVQQQQQQQLSPHPPYAPLPAIHTTRITVPRLHPTRLRFRPHPTSPSSHPFPSHRSVSYSNNNT